MNITQNPFTTRGTIHEPNHFIGRVSQINLIVSRLQAMQSCSVVGPWRIGRSSILYHLFQTGTQLLKDERYRFLYIEMTDARAHTAVDFLHTILLALNCSTEGIKDENKLNRNLAAFGKEIAVLKEIEERIVLCLDEFEALFDKQKEFPPEFFQVFRTMVNDRRLALVIATTKRLEIYSQEGKLPARFFSLFETAELAEFTDEEAEQFIATHHQYVNFTERELQLINSYLDPHPLKLQILCDQVLQNRERQWRDQVLIEEVSKACKRAFGEDTWSGLRKVKRHITLDSISKVLSNLKNARDLLTGK